MDLTAEDFIPSLAGYVQALPIITTLRLCNRYAQGPACGVNKLPTEIIELIETHVHVATRKSAFAEWEQQKKCTEGTCACDFDAQELLDPRVKRHQSLLASSEATQIGEIDQILGLEAPSSSTTCTIDSAAGCAKLHHVCLPHYENVRNFSLRTRDFRALDADARLMKRHFGLEIWTPIRHSYDVHPEDVRLRPAGSSYVDLSTRERMLLHHKSMSKAGIYLMLPGFMETRCEGSIRCPERALLGETFATASCPDRKMMRRFLRVFRLLQLLPDERLRLLERVVNLVECNGESESNCALTKRLRRKGAEFDEGRNGHLIYGSWWPAVIEVARRVSWESRMQTSWLRRDS